MGTAVKKTIYNIGGNSQLNIETGTNDTALFSTKKTVDGSPISVVALAIGGSDVTNTDVTASSGLITMSNTSIVGDSSVGGNVTVSGQVESTEAVTETLTLTNSANTTLGKIYCSAGDGINRDLVIDPYPEDTGADNNNGTVVIRGNLQVLGTETTVNTNVVTVTDNTFRINHTDDGLGNGSAANAVDGAYEIMTGNNTSAKLLYKIADSTWRMEQNNSALADVHMAGLHATSFTNTGNSNFTNINASGNIDVGGTLSVTGTSTLDSLVTAKNGLTVLNGLTSQNATTLNGATQINSTLGATGNTTLGATLDVTGATTLNAATQINSTLGATGNTTLGATLDVTGATTLSDTLAVTGTTTLGGATQINSTLGATGATTLGNTLAVTGATTLGDTLAVTGATTLGGATQINSTLGATGATTLGNTLAVSGATILNDTLNVTGDATFSSHIVGGTNGLFVNDDLVLTSGHNLMAPTVEFYGGNINNTAIGNTTPSTGKFTTVEMTENLTVAGNTTSGTLNVNGPSTMSVLTVNGPSTMDVLNVNYIDFTGNLFGGPESTITVTTLTVNDTATLAGPLNVNGATTLNNTLAVTGTTTLGGATQINSTLGATGATTLGNTLAVTGATTLGDTLAVTGATTLGGATQINSTLGATGATTLGNTLAVSGATILNDTLNVTGDATFSSHIVGGTNGLFVNDDLVLTSGHNLMAPTVEFYGGNINNTAIGNTTPSTGKFTTVETTGNLTVNGNTTSGTLNVNGPSTMDVLNVNYIDFTGNLFGGPESTITVNTLTVNDTATLAGPLNVNGPTTLNNTLAVTGGDLTVANNLDVGGKLTVERGTKGILGQTVVKAAVTQGVPINLASYIFTEFGSTDHFAVGKLIIGASTGENDQSACAVCNFVRINSTTLYLTTDLEVNSTNVFIDVDTVNNTVTFTSGITNGPLNWQMRIIPAMTNSSIFNNI